MVIEIQKHLYQHLYNLGADMSQFMEAEDKSGATRCPVCDASLKEFWHPLTPLLARALVKAYKHVSSVRENRFGRGEIELTQDEYSNFTKLSFHGLIAKYKTDGKHERGYWLLTARGALFLKNEMRVPVRVKTFRNHVIEHDDNLVNIAEVMGSTPYLDTDPEFTLRDLSQ